MIQSVTTQCLSTNQATTPPGFLLDSIQIEQLLMRVSFIGQENQQMAHLIKLLSEQQSKSEKYAKTMELLQEQLKNALKKMKKRHFSPSFGLNKKQEEIKALMQTTPTLAPLQKFADLKTLSETSNESAKTP